MPKSHEVGPAQFIEAAGVAGGSYDPALLWQQLGVGPEWAAMSGTPEASVGVYLASINQFVTETAQAIQSQKQYLAFMRSRMTPAAISLMESEIARSSEANTEALGQAWFDLRNRGYYLRTRHPETGQVAYVDGIGVDESDIYQTQVSGLEEPWPLVDGNQLHI